MMWHVLIRTKYPSFKNLDGSKTREHDFITDAPNAKAAGRKAVEQVFGDRIIAAHYVDHVEIWPATRLRASAR